MPATRPFCELLLAAAGQTPWDWSAAAAVDRRRLSGVVMLAPQRLSPLVNPAQLREGYLSTEAALRQTSDSLHAVGATLREIRQLDSHRTVSLDARNRQVSTTPSRVVQRLQASHERFERFVRGEHRLLAEATLLRSRRPEPRDDDGSLGTNDDDHGAGGVGGVGRGAGTASMSSDPDGDDDRQYFEEEFASGGLRVSQLAAPPHLVAHGASTELVSDSGGSSDHTEADAVRGAGGGDNVARSSDDSDDARMQSSIGLVSLRDDDVRASHRLDDTTEETLGSAGDVKRVDGRGNTTGSVDADADAHADAPADGNADADAHADAVAYAFADADAGADADGGSDSISDPGNSEVDGQNWRRLRALGHVSARPGGGDYIGSRADKSSDGHVARATAATPLRDEHLVQQQHGSAGRAREVASTCEDSMASGPSDCDSDNGEDDGSAAAAQDRGDLTATSQATAQSPRNDVIVDIEAHARRSAAFKCVGVGVRECACPRAGGLC
jgi:hypothetical protein